MFGEVFNDNHGGASLPRALCKAHGATRYLRRTVMKGSWAYVSGLLDLPKLKDPAERLAAWRQSMVTPSRTKMAPTRSKVCIPTRSRKPLKLR